MKSSPRRAYRDTERNASSPFHPFPWCGLCHEYHGVTQVHPGRPLQSPPQNRWKRLGDAGVSQPFYVEVQMGGRLHETGWDQVRKGRRTWRCQRGVYVCHYQIPRMSVRTATRRWCRVSRKLGSVDGRWSAALLIEGRFGAVGIVRHRWS